MKTVEFKQYRRKGLSEMIPFKEFIGEDMSTLSVSNQDKLLSNEEFELGYVARNPKNHSDIWYVAKKYFDDNLEEYRSQASELPSVYSVIESRIKHFKAVHHTHEASELKQALDTIQRLIPPISFKIDGSITSKDARIQELEEWISIEDRLPDIGAIVLVVLRHTKKNVYSGFRANGGWYTFHIGEQCKHYLPNSIQEAQITHWKNLPTPPKP